MSRKEIAKHLLSEFHSNGKRIKTKVGFVAKEMLKADKKFHTYKQSVGSNSLFTIYIYGVDKKGIDYAAGLWFRSEKGMCWVTGGALDDVVFYNDHFFKRYAERYLKKEMSTLDAASEFYREYKPTIGRHTEEVTDRVYKVQLPLIVGGMALGFHDMNTNIIVYNTYISSEILRNDQIEVIEDYKELNEILEKMDYQEWIQIGKSLKE